MLSSILLHRPLNIWCCLFSLLFQTLSGFIPALSGLVFGGEIETVSGFRLIDFHTHCRGKLFIWMTVRWFGKGLDVSGTIIIHMNHIGFQIFDMSYL